MPHDANTRRSVGRCGDSERVVCPCGCIFQAVSASDECWACGQSAGATKAEEKRIVAGIRALPEVDS